MKDPASGKLLYSDMPWDLEGEVDHIPEGKDQFDSQKVSLLEDLPKTPEEFKKYANIKKTLKVFS